MIFEYIPNIETKVLARSFLLRDIRLYTYKVLEALEYAHTHGIMHRDVKPLNIIINHSERVLKLIDWGLADYYKPDSEYNVRVASRYYKSPELLVEDKKYNYSLDIWSLGCTLAGWMFNIDTFFKGTDNYDQMARIVNICGSSDLREYLRKYKINMPSQIAKRVKAVEKVPFKSFISSKNEHRICNEGLDLLEKMLVYDKNERITPADALKHPFLASIHDFKTGKTQQLVDVDEEI